MKFTKKFSILRKVLKNKAKILHCRYNWFTYRGDSHENCQRGSYFTPKMFYKCFRSITGIILMII